jgi:hypothetical protein
VARDVERDARSRRVKPPSAIDHARGG